MLKICISEKERKMLAGPATKLRSYPYTYMICTYTYIYEDPWENVSADEHSLRMAAELFEKFDADGDGHWNLVETSQAQLATEGMEMTEDAFNGLIWHLASLRKSRNFENLHS